MTAALAAAGALAFITGSAILLRHHPIWQGPGVRHPGSPPRPPRQYPAPRDWGESRLPSAADRTAQFAAISDQASGERVMPGPWEPAPEPVTPEPDLPPLPEYLPAPAQPHAAPDVRGRVHDGCDLSDTGQQAALTALSEPAPVAVHYAPDTSGLAGDIDVACGTLRWAIVSDDPGKVTCRACLESHVLDGNCGCPECCRRTVVGYKIGGDIYHPADVTIVSVTESDQAICLCGKVPDLPGEPVTSEADCPAHGDPPADSTMFGGPPSDPAATLTDMRPVPAPVAARENAAARWSLRAHVSHTLAWTPPLRRYVEETIGTSPAEDWERLLEQARAGAVSE